MKIKRNRSALHRGFSLIELIVAMGISMVLLAALSSIFAQSISSREKIDREGQKIETARYALDTLAEDIRLAGYYGTLAPGLPGITLVSGATPGDYVYVDPCSTMAFRPDPTNAPPHASTNPLTTNVNVRQLPGWSTNQDQTDLPVPITVPMPIFGYEAHDYDPATNPLPSALIACLESYKTRTDVLVVRRASNSPVATAAATAGVPYLQVSSCAEGSVEPVPRFPPRFIASATPDSANVFRLRSLGCNAASAFASLLPLNYRIYFVSSCYDCTAADGIPTLKVAFLTVKSAASKKADGVTIRSASCAAAADSTDLCIDVNDIAPNVEDLHIEYGVDLYEVGGTETGTADGSIEAWLVSNNNPRMNTALAGTPVKNPVTASDPTPAEMRIDAATGENRWEDVMAVKLFLITRDPQTTAGHVDTKSFIMGSKTVAAAGDAYRRRLMSSTVKLVNMAGRREAP